MDLCLSKHSEVTEFANQFARKSDIKRALDQARNDRENEINSLTLYSRVDAHTLKQSRVVPAKCLRETSEGPLVLIPQHDCRVLAINEEDIAESKADEPLKLKNSVTSSLSTDLLDKIEFGAVYTPAEVAQIKSEMRALDFPKVFAEFDFDVGLLSSDVVPDFDVLIKDDRALNGGRIKPIKLNVIDSAVQQMTTKKLVDGGLAYFQRQNDDDGIVTHASPQFVVHRTIGGATKEGTKWPLRQW